ncbi:MULTISPECIES: nucleoside hydrolase [Cohnella]|uniref:nucleoside hydrolase n=1 Tax=Cohnella TaxID=329857 RepID=UPI0009BA44F6|nr:MULTISPECIES: nucleoside hydrolase [Cohnella]MBN2980868.1 nucleoside hydrolase [Cohnella algarum]
MAKKVLIDCDPGIDDSIAIMLALKHPDIEVMAITATSGNLIADRTCENALKILEFMNETDIPVAKGMNKPLVRPFPKDPYSHGEDGLGNHFFAPPRLKALDMFAPDLIIETVMKHPGEVTIAALGPLTNLALAFMRKPELAAAVKEIVLIGGAFGFNEYAFRNATGDNPASEWNVYVDPEAAEIVFGCGAKVTAVGLDVAYHPDINFKERHYDRLRRATSKEAKYMLGIDRYVKEGSTVGSFDSSSGIIDSVAIASIIDPSLLETQEIKVAVEKVSPLTLGQTVWDRRDHFRWEHLQSIYAASGLDSERFLDLLVGVLEQEQ